MCLTDSAAHLLRTPSVDGSAIERSRALDGRISTRAKERNKDRHTECQPRIIITHGPNDVPHLPCGIEGGSRSRTNVVLHMRGNNYRRCSCRRCW
jgi:hypothetical protein